MFSQSTNAIFSATRLLFKRRRALALMLIAYAGFLTAVYLFVSTREATISQLILTTAVVAVAPALFLILQAISVNYANDSVATVRKVLTDCLKMILVTVPVIALTVGALNGLNRVDSHPAVITTLRYLLIGVVVPLLAIQLWIAISNSGRRSLFRNLRKVVARTFAPESVFVYGCGFLFFAVGPYFLVVGTISSERAWLEFSLLILRLAFSALLVLIGWITTVGAISILSRSAYATAKEE